MKFGGTLSRKHKKFLDRAITLSRMSGCREYKHGAIIVKNGNTIAVGVNYDVNDPSCIDDDVVARERASIHAEVAALNACRKTNLKGAVIYVARTTRAFGIPAMSKPCVRCQKALKKRGISHVFYTVDSEMEL